MIKLKNILTKILEVICVIMFVFITIVGTYQIVTRYVFNAPSTVSEELLTYSFTWLALLAAALVFAKREHMRMGFLADKFSGKRPEMDIYFFGAFSNIVCGAYYDLRRNKHNKTDNDSGYSLAWNTDVHDLCYSSDMRSFCNIVWRN